MTEEYKLKPKDVQSMDIAQDTISKLKQILPEVFTEGVDGNCSIDIEKLKIAIGGGVDVGADDATRYSFNWSGKKQAQAEANKPSMATLRPSVEDSKDWDNTNNVYIEGDNLEVLKLLQKSYYGQIKMIYIDPPYNTGKDFVYKDKYEDNLKNYLQKTGQIDPEGNNIDTNNDSAGKYHTNWLNMMYPRLKLARNLLRDDGVIFISIDDNEVHNLRKICDEIFSAENVDCIVWNKESEGKSGTLKQTLRYRNIHEYIIICYKNKETTRFDKISEPLEAKYGILETANLAVNEDKVKEGHENWYELISPSGKKWYKHWKFKQSLVLEFLEENLIYWGKEGNNQPRLIIPSDYRRKVYSTSIIEKSSTTAGRKDCEDLIGANSFSYPKPIKLINHLLQISSTADEIILDFFSGSATTAHAVMQLNAEDGGNRRYICVQLPEVTPDASEARKAGYKNICEIGKERIRRAGDKILSEWQAKQKANDLLVNESQTIAPDIGFKVFKLDTSNVKPFDSKDMFADNLLVTGRSTLDLFYELVLKQGYSLDYRQTILDIGGTKCYALINTDGKPFVLAVLDDNVKPNFATQILKYALTLVIVKDDCFNSDEVKLNTLATLEQLQNKDNPLQIRIV